MTAEQAREQLARDREQLAEAKRIGEQLRNQLGAGADTRAGAEQLRERMPASPYLYEVLMGGR